MLDMMHRIRWHRGHELSVLCLFFRHPDGLVNLFWPKRR